MCSSFSVMVEPSHGHGAFVDALLERGARDVVYFDIDCRDDAHRADFIRDPLPPAAVSAREGGLRVLTVGNPPFGKNASGAIAFFNRAAEFSDVVAFVLPKTFRKDSVLRRLDRHFFLVKDVDVPDDSFVFADEVVTVPCAFQVWMHGRCGRAGGSGGLAKTPFDVPGDGLRPLPRRLNRTRDFCFLAPSEREGADLAMRRVGVNAGVVFEDPADVSPSSHHYLKLTGAAPRADVLRRLRGLDASRRKRQTAGCPSIGMTEICELYENAARREECGDETREPRRRRDRV